MINVNDKKVMEVIQYIHNSVLRKNQKTRDINKEILKENQLLAMLCQNMYLEPREYAIALNEKYDYNLSGNDIIQMLRNRKISHQNERNELLEWARDVAEYFSRAILGKKEDFDKYDEKAHEFPLTLKGGRGHRSQERIAVIMIYEKYPEIDIFHDKQYIYNLGDTLGKYLFFDISDAICSAYGFMNYKEKQKMVEQNKISYEQALHRIEQLERILNRTNAMFQDLQNDFAEQLQESKMSELTNFFARLNSEKYGCILDELLIIHKGVNELRRNNYKLPVEINGLLIMIKNLTQFIRDSHIEPIMKIGSIKEVTASEIEYCNYEGSPFVNNEQKKKVKVVSAGWVYKDKDLQVAIPKVKEEK